MSEATIASDKAVEYAPPLLTDQSEIDRNFSSEHARARLCLGMSSVGFWTLFCGLGLFFNWELWFAIDAPGNAWLSGLLTLGFFFLIHAVISAPMDFLGGYWIPRRFQRAYLRQSAGNGNGFGSYLNRWLASVTKDLMALSVFAFILLIGANLGGPWVMVLMASALLMTATLLQSRFARSWSQIRKTDSKSSHSDVVFMKATDPAFSGGITGFPGRETIILPELWKEKLGEDSLDLAIQRRKAAIRTGLRTQGWIVAALWNLIGLTLGILFTSWDGTTAAGLIRVIFVSTLWQFFGLLVLPTMNRRAVRSLEREMRRCGHADQKLSKLNSTTSAWQDGEIKRSPWIETIFHPLPSVESRDSANQSPESDSKPTGAWHVVRTMLYLSIPVGGILHRAVHCNIGRPDLWILAPVD